jgi:DNA-binding NtrC family response regulator
VPKLRALDHAAPHTGGSLSILMPETDARAALAAAKQLLAAISGEDAIACGVASLPEAGTQPAQLMAACERALERCSRLDPCHAAQTPNEAPAFELAQVQAPRCNAAMLELEKLIERLAPRRISVLVLGETGTGKELVARDLHRLSRRSTGPLKIVNCAAIPESLLESVLFGHIKGAFTGAVRDRPGVFAQAHAGTLFLDEVGELSAGAQAALLRALDTGRICPVGGSDELEVDVRVVAATHRDLASMAESGSFRLDLFHRLNGVSLRVPALRERRDEIQVLAEHFIAHLHDSASPPPRLSRAALSHLLAHPWPGNVRELRNVIERAMALCDGDTLEVQALQGEPPAATSCKPVPVAATLPADLSAERELALRPSLEAHEIDLIREALRRTSGNQRRAADLLQLPLRTLERKLKLLGPRARSS